MDAGGAVGRVGGGDVGAVRRLHRQYGEEGPVVGPGRGGGEAAAGTRAAVHAAGGGARAAAGGARVAGRGARAPPGAVRAASCGTDVAAQMGDQQVAEGVGLVAGQPHGRLAVGAVHVALVLVVVVLVAHPVAEPAAPLRRHVMGGVVAAVQVPLADVGGVVAGGLERMRDGGDVRGQGGGRAGGSGLMRVAAGQQRAAKRGAPRRAGDRGVEAHPLARKIVDVGREYVRVAAVAGGVRAVLVAEHPQHVGRARRAQCQPVAHRRGQTRPGNDWPRTCLKGGILGASVTAMSCHELARM